MNHPLRPNCIDVRPFELAIVARGTARLTIPELAAMRKQPPANFSPKLSPLFLKHSDEQTLAALTALYRAKAEWDLDGEDFGPWAVVSISRYLGRGAFAALRDKYTVDGPWGVSVQVVPHRTAHSVSGTISLGLGLHGPAIGANGGIHGENTGLLSLPCILQQREWQGAWLVCSNWSPEVTVDQKGQAISDSVCLAAALALVNVEPVERRTPIGYVRFEPVEPSAANASDPRLVAGRDIGLLEYICDDAERRESDHRVWQRSLGNGLRIEIGLSVPAGVTS